jgi:hypothetical protein
MVKFGQHFRQELIADWRAHYVPYPTLKREVKRLWQLQEGGAVEASALADGVDALEAQVAGDANRAALFFELQRAALARDVDEARRLAELSAQQARGPRGHPPWPVHVQAQQLLACERLLASFHRLGEQATKLYHFQELNSTALRKILKKAAKRLRSTRRAPLLVRVGRSPESPLARDLTRLRDAFIALQPAIVGVQEGIAGLQERLDSSELPWDKPRSPLWPQTGHSPPLGPAIEAMLASPVVRARHEQMRQRGLAILGDMAAMRLQAEESSGAFLALLTQRAQIPFKPALVRTHSSIQQQQQKQNQQQHMDPSRRPDDAAAGAAGGAAIEEDRMSIRLNLISTLLYLVSYNICLPSSAAYAGHFGLPPSFAGVIVSMTPIAALCSAVLYSYWSNFSYKQPMLCSALLLLLGNALYALAWDVGCVELIFAGRFVNGLGGCRAVNRRYIADSVRVENRTRESAAFIAAGAVGMACGPLLASLLQGADLVLSAGRVTLTVNAMTAPAWFMSFVMAGFALVVAAQFKEPPRDALAQLAVRDEADSASDASDDDKLEEADPDPDTDDAIDIVLAPADSSARPLTDPAAPQRSYGTPAVAGRGGVGGSARGGDGYEPLPSARERRREAARTQMRLVALLLWTIFWAKLVQESCLTDMAVATPDLYQWTTGEIGVYMVVFALAVLPLNLLVVTLSQRHSALDDAFWITWLLAPLTLASAALVGLGDADTPVSSQQYAAAALAAFALSSVLEGVTMSLFTKVIPPRLAAGTFNSGFLSTEAGTLGRAVGDAVITALGTGTEVQLQRNLSLLLAGISGLTTLAAVTLLRPRRAGSAR